MAGVSELFVILGLRSDLSDAVKRETDKTKQAMTGLGSSSKTAMGQVTEAFQNFQSKYGTYVTAISATSIAISGLLASTRNIRADLSATAVLLGTGSEDWRHYAQSVSTNKIPLEEFTAISDKLARSGVTNREDIKRSAEEFSHLGYAVGQPATAIADELIPVFKAFKVPLTDVNKYSTELFSVYKRGGDLGEFATVIGRNSIALKKHNVTLEDAIAYYDLMVDRGVPVRQASTLFNKAIQEVTDSEKAGAEAQKAYTASLKTLEEQQTRSAKLQTEYQKNMADLAKSLKEQSETLENNYNKAIRDQADAITEAEEQVREYEAALADAKDNSEEITKATKDYEDSLEALKDAETEGINITKEYQQALKDLAAESAAQAADISSDYTDSLVENGKAMDSAKASLSKYRAELREAGVSSEQIARIESEYNYALNAVNLEKERAAEITARYQENMASAAGNIEEQTRLTKEYQSEMLREGEVIDGLVDKISKIRSDIVAKVGLQVDTASIDGLLTAIDSINTSELKAIEINTRYNAGINNLIRDGVSKVTQKTEEYNSALEENKKSVSDATEQSENYKKTLDNVTNDFSEVAEATKQYNDAIQNVADEKEKLLEIEQTHAKEVKKLNEDMANSQTELTAKYHEDTKAISEDMQATRGEIEELKKTMEAPEKTLMGVLGEEIGGISSEEIEKLKELNRQGGELYEKYYSAKEKKAGGLISYIKNELKDFGVEAGSILAPLGDITGAVSLLGSAWLTIQGLQWAASIFGFGKAAAIAAPEVGALAISSGEAAGGMGAAGEAGILATAGIGDAGAFATEAATLGMAPLAETSIVAAGGVGDAGAAAAIAAGPIGEYGGAAYLATPGVEGLGMASSTTSGEIALAGDAAVVAEGEIAAFGATSGAAAGGITALGAAFTAAIGMAAAVIAPFLLVGHTADHMQQDYKTATKSFHESTKKNLGESAKTIQAFPGIIEDEGPKIRKASDATFGEMVLSLNDANEREYQEQRRTLTQIGELSPAILGFGPAIKAATDSALSSIPKSLEATNIQVYDQTGKLKESFEAVPKAIEGTKPQISKALSGIGKLIVDGLSDAKQAAIGAAESVSGFIKTWTEKQLVDLNQLALDEAAASQALAAELAAQGYIVTKEQLEHDKAINEATGQKMETNPTKIQEDIWIKQGKGFRNAFGQYVAYVKEATTEISTATDTVSTSADLIEEASKSVNKATNTLLDSTSALTDAKKALETDMAESTKISDTSGIPEATVDEEASALSNIIEGAMDGIGEDIGEVIFRPIAEIPQIELSDDDRKMLDALYHGDVTGEMTLPQSLTKKAGEEWNIIANYGMESKEYQDFLDRWAAMETPISDRLASAAEALEKASETGGNAAIAYETAQLQTAIEQIPVEAKSSSRELLNAINTLTERLKVQYNATIQMGGVSVRNDADITDLTTRIGEILRTQATTAGVRVS